MGGLAVWFTDWVGTTPIRAGWMMLALLPTHPSLLLIEWEKCVGVAPPVSLMVELVGWRG